MRTKIAIVGSGVTAGLAANLLAPLYDIVLFQSPKPSSSGIPEIVPRRAFFDALTTINEVEAISQTAPTIKRVFWQRDDKDHWAKLTSTDEYFVYDKGRLAAFMAECIPAAQCVNQEITHIADLVEFDRVFDCRGAKSVMNDPEYQSHIAYPARTACRYLVISSFSIDRDKMCFWSENIPDGSKRTFFIIPIGNDRVSLGCSCLPSDMISEAELLTAMVAKEVVIVSESIILSGYAEPEERVMSCSISHVSPLGDAHYLSCPLSEYGTLKSLSQIRVETGAEALPPHLFQRENKGEVDPHLPQELFL